MWDIFLQTLPFFMLIGLGYGSGRTGFFSPEATAYLTKFVFYFALSAMLFRFAANLSLGEIFDWQFVLAYLSVTSRSGPISPILTCPSLASERSAPRTANCRFFSSRFRACPRNPLAPVTSIIS